MYSEDLSSSIKVNYTWTMIYVVECKPERRLDGASEQKRYTENQAH